MLTDEVLKPVLDVVLKPVVDGVLDHVVLKPVDGVLDHVLEYVIWGKENPVDWVDNGLDNGLVWVTVWVVELEVVEGRGEVGREVWVGWTKEKSKTGFWGLFVVAKSGLIDTDLGVEMEFETDDEVGKREEERESGKEKEDLDWVLKKEEEKEEEGKREFWLRESEVKVDRGEMREKEESK